MLNKSIVLLVILLVISISFTTVFALTDLQKTTIIDPWLVNTFGIPIGNNVNVYQQFQISANITNNQEKSQKKYLVQIKNNEGFVVSLG